MKVFTLHQPWASLIALGVKTIETRSWSTSYRGPLAIHAGLSKVGATQCSECWDALYAALRSAQRAGDEIPLGAIVATCTLVDVVPTKEIVWNGPIGEPWLRGGPPYQNHPAPAYVSESQRPYGDFTAGRFAWLLADVVPVDPPVPFKGGQGLTRTWER